MDISCAFPTTLDSPDHVALAEELGYERAWLYDTPQQSPDVWMTLALAAERTERIGLGPGRARARRCAIPMVNAAATATLEALAPGRVAVAFGTGFTGRRAMGYGAIPWAFMDAYIRAYRGLLRGETIEWEGARMRMLHPPGHAAPRPVDVPIIIGALGPKGAAVARELGDGLFVTLALPEFATEFERVSYLFWGTVLDDGEDPGSERVRAAGGPGLGARLPRGLRVRDAARGPARRARSGRRSSSEPRRRSATSPSTSSTASASTRPTARPGTPAATSMLDEVTVSGTADEVRERLAGLADHGVTELVFQPCGPDIRRELEVFMDTAKPPWRR